MKEYQIYLKRNNTSVVVKRVWPHQRGNQYP